MRADKVLGRIENVSWKPPVLRFQIERHGGTVLGSSRAELQHWRIDLDSPEAEYVNSGYRQIRPREAPIKAEQLAREFVDAIVRSRKDEARPECQSQGQVTILIRKVLPADGHAKQTTLGRRKRLEAFPFLCFEGFGGVPPADCRKRRPFSRHSIRSDRQVAT